MPIWVAAISTCLACGTILYPERRGTKDAGRVDPAVVVMDGLLLLVFIVPGVAAFAVDFATGAIYEPDSRSLAEAGDHELLVLPAETARRFTVARAPAHATGARSPASLSPFYWLTPDGRRVATRYVDDDAADGIVVESESPLSPGRHRLVARGPGDEEHSIAITLI